MNNDNYIVSSILTGMQGWVIPLDVNTHQFTDNVLGCALGGYTADSNPGLPTRIAIFNPTNDWTRVMLIRVIPEIYTAYNKLKVNSDDEVALALAEVIRVAAVHRVTDTYGAFLIRGSEPMTRSPRPTIRSRPSTNGCSRNWTVR